MQPNRGEMSCSSSSSGEEDGDAQWKAAIDSVSSLPSATTATTTTSGGRGKTSSLLGEDNNTSQNQVKHYQIKAQYILNDILEKSLEVVSSSTSSPPAETSADNGIGVQLFKHAPHGIVFDHIDEVKRPSKKPKLLPGDEIDERSKKFQRKLQSVVINGVDILAAARDAGQKSRAKLERKEVAAKAAAKREEERVTELKKIRGERWLPCMAKEQLAKSQ